MNVRFSEDVVPLTDMKTNPGRVVRHAAESHRPVLLTRRGRGIAVVQSVADYEAAEEERAFLRAVVEGLADLEAGRDVSLLGAKSRLVVENRPEGVLLKPARVFAETRSDDVFERLACDGPPRSLEEMEAGVLAEARRRHAGG